MSTQTYFVLKWLGYRGPLTVQPAREYEIQPMPIDNNGRFTVMQENLTWHEATALCDALNNPLNSRL